MIAGVAGSWWGAPQQAGNSPAGTGAAGAPSPAGTAAAGGGSGGSSALKGGTLTGGLFSAAASLWKDLSNKALDLEAKLFLQVNNMRQSALLLEDCCLTPDARLAARGRACPDSCCSLRFFFSALQASDTAKQSTAVMRARARAAAGAASPAEVAAEEKRLRSMEASLSNLQVGYCCDFLW